MSKHTQAILILALLTVASTAFAAHVGLSDDGPGVWLNGAAAVITAIACLADSRRTTDAVRLLTERVIVLETKTE